MQPEVFGGNMWVSIPEVPGCRGFPNWVGTQYIIWHLWLKSMWVVCIFNFLKGIKVDIYRSNVLFILFQELWGLQKIFAHG